LSEICSKPFYALKHILECLAVKVKPVFGILFLLLSVIISGCIDQDNNLPLPETLSDTQKEAFIAVEPDIFLKNPEAYTNSNILLRGKVTWISYEGGKTLIIIILQTYNREPVVVYYYGRLPEEYRGEEVSVYGIARGRGTIKNTNTGEDIEVPEIHAVQINPSWIDEPIRSATSNLTLVAESKTMVTGETWYMGGGYSIKLQALDEKANPKQVWISLEREGKKLDDRVLIEGEIYSYQNKVSFIVYSISYKNLLLKNVRFTS